MTMLYEAGGGLLADLDGMIQKLEQDRAAIQDIQVGLLTLIASSGKFAATLVGSPGEAEEMEEKAKAVAAATELLMKQSPGPIELVPSLLGFLALSEKTCREIMDGGNRQIATLKKEREERRGIEAQSEKPN